MLDSKLVWGLNVIGWIFTGIGLSKKIKNRMGL